jgi:hypothetical protein
VAQGEQPSHHGVPGREATAGNRVTTPWAAVAANIAGVQLIRHQIVTYNGTWGSGLIQYPSDVINGLAQYVDDGLCEEVPCPYPATFGPIGGSATSPSYQQSINDGYQWTGNWLNDVKAPDQTWGGIGYSQGAELAATVQMALAPGGQLEQHADTFIGGITFGNPRRMAGAAAPGIGNPGPQWRGISSVQMPALPTINGQVVWADYFHSTTNGDPATDMYACIPDTAVGQIMSDVYTTATQAQLNNPVAFLQSMVTDLEQIVEDSGILSSLKGGLPGLLKLGLSAGIAFLIDLIGGVNINATGANADVAAAILGLQFLAAPGGATAPHISYLGEIPGYTNLVADAVDFLHFIATLTPARA